MDTYICITDFTLLYMWNKHNIVNQLYANKIFLKGSDIESLWVLYICNPVILLGGYNKDNQIIYFHWISIYWLLTLF